MVPGSALWGILSGFGPETISDAGSMQASLVSATVHLSCRLSLRPAALLSRSHSVFSKREGACISCFLAVPDTLWFVTVRADIQMVYGPLMKMKKRCTFNRMMNVSTVIHTREISQISRQIQEVIHEPDLFFSPGSGARAIKAWDSTASYFVTVSPASGASGVLHWRPSGHVTVGTPEGVENSDYPQSVVRVKEAERQGCVLHVSLIP